MRRELQCTWTFWQDQWQQHPSAGKRYLAHLGDAANVKDFYILLNRHTLVTIPTQSSLHIFRKHVKPEWEDEHNINGGHLRFFANLQPGESAEVANKRLSCLWFDVLRSVIGEHIDHSAEVVGVGYTAKPLHPILSVWISTADPTITIAIRNAALQLFAPPAATTATALFTARFYTHKSLTSANEGGFRMEEVTWHRRIRSAPESHVTIGDEEEDPSSSVEASPTHQGASMSLNGQSTTSASLLSRRGLNLPSPIRDHQRSKTASCAAEAIVAQPIKHTPVIAAPTPVKDWTTAFTPSYIVMPPPALTFPPPTEPTVQPPKPLDVSPPKADHTHHPPPPPPATSTKPVAEGARSGPPLPISATPNAEKPNHLYPPAPAPAPEAKVRDSAASDRLPFVFQGTVYPPRMNRKVYRAVLFNQNPEGTVVPGTFPAPANAVDGNISMEQYDEWLQSQSQ